MTLLLLRDILNISFSVVLAVQIFAFILDENGL